MADEASPLVQALLSQASTGSWEEPAPGYLASLPARIRERFRNEGGRLKQLGEEGVKEQARDMFGIGPFVNSYDAAKEGRYPAAAGNALLGAADLAGPARSKAAGAADAALQAWDAAVKARPAQVAEELARLTTKRMKPNTAAAAKREAAAERAIPEPVAPGNFTTEGAQKALGIMDRTWPGNIAAGAITASGASGIPGIVLDDIKGATVGPLNAMRKEQIEENRVEKQLRASPVVEGGNPEVDSYWKQLDTLRHERNMHAGIASGMGAVGGPAAYATMKSVPWAASRLEGGLLGLAAQAALIHPALGLLVAGGALAPFAVPAALGAGTWGLASGTAGQIDQALQKHEKVKALTPLVRKLAENYRADQPNPPSLTPDKAY